jgi:predicted dehydrogenase
MEIVGCCDPVASKARTIAAVFGCQAYDDATRMIAEQHPDVVVLMTPSGDHYRHAKAVLEQGCSVLSEKPITLIPEQAYELIDLAQAKGLSYAGVFQNRYNPAVRKIKEAKQQGRFGTIVTAAIRLRWCRYQDYYEDGWHGTWAQDGGVINQQAIHHVDALNWICGPISAVSACMANRANDLEAEDTLVAVLRFANGALGTIEATTAARPEDFEVSLSIVGETGMAQVGGLALNEIDVWQFIEAQPGDATVQETCSQSVPNGYGLGHLAMFQDIVAAWNADDTPMPVSGADAVKAVEVVHALYASIEQGGWVSLADAPRSRRLGQT